jgi:polysaccharide biosynthesis protein PslH
MAEAPLAGLRVALIHPAWHSCGTATVVASQARAYRELGASVVSLALSDHPAFGLTPQQFTQAYFEATPELAADRRLLAGMSTAALCNPLKIAALGWQFAHADYASTYVSLAENTPVPAELSARRVDFIHCNHFFCMPLAERLRATHGCPVLLDTHDVQADQYVLRGSSGWHVPPRASYEAMIATELGWLRRADLLVHLNLEEEGHFRMLLPERRHALLYPAVDPMPAAGEGQEFVVIASGNLPNVLSIQWFLREVMPRAGDLPLAIYGNVDVAIRGRDPTLWGRYSSHFRGRVSDLARAYRNAACVLLPTREGHGLSIKTVEALSTGAPVIATPHAFRGIGIDLAGLSDVTLADDAESFAAALRAMAGQPRQPAACITSPTRRLYEAEFSPAAYRQRLAGLVGSLLPAGT